MTTENVADRLKEAEEKLQENARNIGSIFRRALGPNKVDAGLHAEGQFYRRLREFCNKEIADIEGVIQDPDHYSR